jgi:glycosyltransferase involved in cell wall biosynthesis
LSADHWIGALAARLSGRQARWAGGRTRIVRTIHHPRTIERRPFRSRLYESLTDGFVTLCERDREQLRRTYRIDPKPVSVIHGAVDTTRFHSNVEARLGRAEFGIKMTTPVVGMVARFQPHRGHEILIEAMARLRKLFPTIRLLLVGRGEHQPVLEQLVRDRTLEPSVIFTGYRDRDLPQIYAAMDVAVLLASGSDGSCRAALEAMAVGRPVVGFPVGALPETIVEGVTGHIVKEETSEALADCLSALLSDQPRLRAMGEAARKRIEAEFTEAVRLQKTEAFYDSLIER